ncbi:hypothetical protein DFQ04_0772 [Algoriphagus boseongensis]|uniref:Uncharacterized protein n=1 Tax=Algoriphagus boseongensis TaxID=1442587 RepID=A0A4R6T8C7_9BACT|nr:hypothetical protein [Algoriphagus boseongensis]TDQ18961.1 hypothetical protein DFQ04_0772 [Algoriphagus boseongensis]
MKKLKSFIALSLIAGFTSATLFTSCGGKKEEATEETTEQMEGEHPAEGGEHPAEHPASDTTATDTTAAG